KLSVLRLITMLISNLSSIADPRHGKDKAYDTAIAISLTHLQADGNLVLDGLSEKSFQQLDMMKQKGLYVNAVEGQLIAQKDAIGPSRSNAVYQFARRLVTTLDFVLKGGNLERYFEFARSIRAKATEKEHEFYERIGKEISDVLFGEESPSQSDDGSADNLK